MGGRIALVTGGSRGIGRACAVALARDGHRVAVCYAHDDAAASDTRAAIEDVGGEALVLRADVSDPGAVDRAFAGVEGAWGRVEVLVVNAGINRDGLLLRMGDEQWRQVLETDLSGAFYSLRRAAAGMVRNRWGRVVMVGSVVGFSGSGGQVNYGAAKAGLVGLARSAARELGSRGITVNVVAPGPITTAMTDALTEERRAKMTEQVPLGRFGTPEDVAALVAFLCSDAAGYITGALVPVDGGMGMGH